MASRCAFLPFTGDPLLLEFWLNLYKNVWRKEVDVLYVLLNANVPVEVVDRCKELCDPFPTVFFESVSSNLDHGPAINRMLDQCEQDLVLLLEEDGFIFQAGYITKYFNMIEDGVVDIVGSPRGSCGHEILDAAHKKWGTPEQTPNFWPCFFFCKRSDLLKTDRHFQAKAWYRGDWIEPLDHKVTDEVVYGDTFVWTSLQLRGMGLKVYEVEQYHSRVEDIQDVNNIQGIFDRKAPWMHIGSLSGWQNVLFSESLPFRIGEVEEWERRAAAFLLFWEKSNPEKLQNFREKYKNGIDRLVEDYTLKWARVKLRADLFDRLMKGEYA